MLVAAAFARPWPPSAASAIHPAPAAVERPPTALRRAFEAGLDSLLVSVDVLDEALARSDRDAGRRAFRAARLAFRHQETLLAYYSPSTESTLDGPLLDDDESAPRPLGQRAAFQRVEAALFGKPGPSRATWESARLDVTLMHETLRQFRDRTTLLDVTERTALDAARVELARVSTLGIAEVDSDESGDAIIESAAALDGIRGIARVAASAPATQVSASTWLTVEMALARASRNLRENPDVDTIDRLEFLAEFAEPAGRALASARREVGPPAATLRVVWRANAATVFDPDAFDPSAFAPDDAIAGSPAVLALGRRLFNDARLSGSSARSCASCHVEARAFTDGLVRHQSIVHGQLVARNTPTLLDVALQPAFFADGRVRTLEEQVGAVLASPSEMASSTTLAASRLNEDAEYRNAFAAALHVSGSGAVTPASVQGVIAAYVRSLVSLDSRFDRAVRGDRHALNASERRGFTVFMGKGRCGSCHFAPLFSGVTPPVFTTSEPEIIGVPVRLDTARARIDPDSGRAGVDAAPEHLYAFKVPTLRNVARTAPYMHNGVYATLEQVVDFYDRGGGAGIGIANAMQSLPARPLHLSAVEQLDLVAFLRSLSDRTRP